MLFYIDSNIDYSLNAFNKLVTQVDDEFESDYKDLIEWQNEIVTKLKEQMRNRCATDDLDSLASNRKRKFKYGDVTVDGTDMPAPEKKRLRSSENGNGKENTKPQQNNNTSTPNKEGVDQSNLFPEEDVSIVPSLDKPRAKRNASVLASAMNNKMLNEKLNVKKRRPDSQSLSKVQEMLLDQQPATLLNNILKTDNKNSSSIIESSPVGKNGVILLAKTDSPLSIISEKLEIDVENEKNTTITRSSKKSNISKEIVPIDSEEAVAAKSNIVAAVTQDVDTSIMPPPSMPVIKKNPPRRGRQKKTDTLDNTSESKNDTLNATANTSTRSLRTRSMRANDSKVADESLETTTRSTRSTRSTADADAAQATEKPKRTRGRKPKGFIEEEASEPEVSVEMPKSKRQQLQTAANISSSDEEFESKKAKTRPKRTRRGKKQAENPVVELETSKENLPKQISKQTSAESQSDEHKELYSNPTGVLEPLPIKKLSNKMAKVDTARTKSSENIAQLPEQEEIEVSSERRTRSFNRIADKEEISLTPKERVKNNVVVNETFDAPSPQVKNKKIEILSETIVLDKSSNNATINLCGTPNSHGLPQPKAPNLVQKESRQALNETVTLSSKPNGQSPLILDQTITLQKDSAIIQYDPQHSLLTDDMSEAEDTPPPLHTKLIPKFISQGIKKIKDAFIESPVKARVQQFERLAEATSPIKAVTNIGAPTRVTRSKIRAIAAKTGLENEVNEQCEVVEVEPEVPSKKGKKVSRSKIATPLGVKAISLQKLPVSVPASKQIGSNVKLGTSSLKLASSASDLLMSPRSNNTNGSNVKLGTSSLKLASSASDLLMSPRANNTTVSSTVSQIYLSKDDALRKREAMLQARSEEQRRKREEKCKAAALAREAQAKQKQALWEKAEKEKEEKLRQIQLEREEKLREEAEKKRLALEKKALETEKRRKAEEAARHAKMMEQEEEAKRQAALRKKQLEDEERLREKLATEDRETARKLQEMKNQSKSKNTGGKTSHLQQQQQKRKSFMKVEHLNTDDESEDDSRIKRSIPPWAKKEHRSELMKIQYYIKPQVVDKLYSATIFNPNLMEIFPQIDRSRLVRTSSAVWKTPPRFSMMPKDYK